MAGAQAILQPANIGPILDAVAEHAIASQVCCMPSVNAMEAPALITIASRLWLPVLCLKMDCSIMAQDKFACTFG